MILLIQVIKKLRAILPWRSSTSLLVSELMILAFGLYIIVFYSFERRVQPDLTVFDTAWVAFITMTTIGYGDISAKTTEGRIATIAFSIVTLGCFTTVVSQFITKLTYIYERRVKGLTRLHLKDHILIVDWNRNLSKITTIVENMRKDPDTSESPIVIISEAFEDLPNQLTDTFHSIHFCHGSPTNQATYIQANSEQARAAIVFASGEEASADAVTAAAVGVIEDLNPRVETVAECLNRDNEGLFRRNGCNRLVYTGEIIPLIMAKTAIDRGVGPAVFETLDIRTGCTLYSVQDAQLDGYTFTQISKCLVDMDERVILQGIVRGRRIILAPENDFCVEDGDGLILLANRKYVWDDPRRGRKGLKQKLLKQLANMQQNEETSG